MSLEYSSHVESFPHDRQINNPSSVTNIGLRLEDWQSVGPSNRENGISIPNVFACFNVRKRKMVDSAERRQRRSGLHREALLPLPLQLPITCQVAILH